VRLFHTEPSVAERMRMMTSEREAIAASIAPNEVLLIGGGATTLHIARRLARDHRSLTVVTHALDIVAALGSNAGITVICTPGQYDARGASRRARDRCLSAELRRASRDSRRDGHHRGRDEQCRGSPRRSPSGRAGSCRGRSRDRPAPAHLADEGLVKGRVGPARAEGVDPDAVPAVVDRHLADHRDHRMLEVV
jgi:hypothetical protein